MAECQGTLRCLRRGCGRVGRRLAGPSSPRRTCSSPGPRSSHKFWAARCVHAVSPSSHALAHSPAPHQPATMLLRALLACLLLAAATQARVLQQGPPEGLGQNVQLPDVADSDPPRWRDHPRRPFEVSKSARPIESVSSAGGRSSPLNARIGWLPAGGGGRDGQGARAVTATSAERPGQLPRRLRSADLKAHAEGQSPCLWSWAAAGYHQGWHGYSLPGAGGRASTVSVGWAGGRCDRSTAAAGPSLHLCPISQATRPGLSSGHPPCARATTPSPLPACLPSTLATLAQTAGACQVCRGRQPRRARPRAGPRRRRGSRPGGRRRRGPAGARPHPRRAGPLHGPGRGADRRRRGCRVRRGE